MPSLLLYGLSPARNLRSLRRDGPLGTLDRLILSRHLSDLRLILSMTLLIGIMAVIGVVIFTFEHVQTSAITGAIFALGGGVFGWVYQAARSRLGAADLVASEISSLCQIMFTVDEVRHFIALDIVKDLPTNTNRFSSQGNYSFIFESVVKDVQQLDGNTVISITEFYTYMKATRDYVHQLDDIQSSDPDFRTKWHMTI